MGDTAFGEVEATDASSGFTRQRLNTGAPAAAGGTDLKHFSLRYPGQQYDEETGLHYNHHRYYDPFLTVGYLEADPIGLAGGGIGLDTSVGAQSTSLILKG